MRLDKLISNSTVFTRSQAGKIIRKGDITVNNSIVKKAAFKVAENDQVHYLGVTIKPPKKRYIMMHKPKDVVCSTADRGHQTVLDLLFISNRESLHIVGRLDLDTTGLLLITDDGQWSHRITSPKHQHAKIYHATLADTISDEAIKRLEAGIMLKGEDKPTLPAEVKRLDSNIILLTLYEGKYHQVKRMLAAVGHYVEQLHREKIGKIVLDNGLKAGEWRELSADEINL
ncbi:MAG TPA: 16S rRNA pseudouridine(516) synthase [Leucothrix mucor]|uniref:Pseudouridine synthase n=1 Tax=Leucothrix mucor TaxID=45248 RepID=A0A7V2T264_LEUMU|nr:16S rRNA pseudouridine(516) synthase [Leucothrix mucor]